ncbi:MAG TPA: YicC/YloC family endoribonuclease [Verrucomicrobiae bacterium]|nr:YicC/YloC family endoribonuclease [Verrucomicrobiae bacterium]
MNSMTGYGRGECSQRGFKVTIEISSVNRKQIEIAVNLPRDLEVLEAQIRDQINRRVARGRLTVRVSVHAAEGAAKMRIDSKLAKLYAKELRALAKSLHLADPVTLDMLARAPGVLQATEEIGEAEELWPAASKALNAALDVLLKMREREGGSLAKDLKSRIAQLRAGARRVQDRAPKVAERHREQLMARIKTAGLETPGMEDERLAKEIFYFADRSDITEELTRLQSHFQQFDDCVKSAEPVGRTLDFLAQEINREINTIGSKANDTDISREVVLLKAELERFREQVQNVE